MSNQLVPIAENISLANLVPAERKTPMVRLLIRALDKVLGVNKLDRLYQQNQMRGLDKETFAQKLLQALELKIEGVEELQAKIPKTGPVIIASNHPFGGIEGVILALFIGIVRPDLKVLVNQGLKLFPELNDYFIYTNPLSEKNPSNGPSLRQCKKHVCAGNALLIFPAGRVSYYQKDKGRISEHEWNRVVGRLIQSCEASFVPVFVDGQNSPWFYRLGRVYFRLRMLMLAHELYNKHGKKVSLYTGTPLQAKYFRKQNDDRTLAALCRVQSYAQDPSWLTPWKPDPVTSHKPLAEPVKPELLLEELNQLPAEQHMVDYKDYGAFYGFQAQMPNIVNEIARLRELVFREHNEGSGEPIDTDHFDATYTHLFVINRKTGVIAGAYRMGQTDKLLENGGLEALYLNRMFKFGPDFVNQQQPCLELGRSFLVPEYQRSYQGLFLLWKGISTFIAKNPQYNTLYGTVSISKLYDPRSAAVIEKAVVKPGADVQARWPFEHKLHPEIADFAKDHDLLDHLSPMLGTLEQDGKDIPILMKHYMKCGARFHCLGIDKNFNDTPGLLLSVDLCQSPRRILSQYMGELMDDFMRYHKLEL